MDAVEEAMGSVKAVVEAEEVVSREESQGTLSYADYLRVYYESFTKS